ncbi:MAG TPA: hypothetical protein VGO78_23095, partial [Acidimicrobiales bacterium]|nr:hypothetical protein [Acidimicrobiales bacterium]
PARRSDRGATLPTAARTVPVWVAPARSDLPAAVCSARTAVARGIRPAGRWDRAAAPARPARATAVGRVRANPARVIVAGVGWVTVVGAVVA